MKNILGHILIILFLGFVFFGGGTAHGATSHQGPANHDAPDPGGSSPGQDTMADAHPSDHMDHGDMDHGKMDHGQMDHGDHVEMIMAAGDPKTLAEQVKIEEKLGAFADLKAQFRDSSGGVVDLEKIFERPVVILPVFFTCTSICNLLQAELTNALSQVKALPGEDFNIITLSFSDDEGPEIARASKRNYTTLLKREIPLDRWYYLTGDRENILRFTDSLGYFFIKKKKHFYIHPNALVVLGTNGKIIRYLYGPNFLPFDLGMAVSEAHKGEPGISIKRGVLSFCFDYDPENKTYVFKMFRVSGTAILILLGGFVFFLLRPSSKRGRVGAKDPDPPPDS